MSDKKILLDPTIDDTFGVCSHILTLNDSIDLVTSLEGFEYNAFNKIVD